MNFDEYFMLLVERRFAIFMKISTEGIRKNYHRRCSDKARSEVVCSDAHIELLTCEDVEFTGELCPFTDDRIVQAFKLLPPRQKDVLLKIFREHLTIMEIAKLWGISASGVSVTKKRALDRIARLYKGDM